jgi:arylsulfatase A-like enzyme
MDIFATCCELAQVAPPAEIDAESFLPTLVGQPQPASSRMLYFCRREGGISYGGKTIEALIQGPWKLLQDSPFGPLELYNLRDDPQETTDLAFKQKAVLRDLAATLRQQIQRGGEVPWQRPSNGSTRASVTSSSP